MYVSTTESSTSDMPTGTINWYFCDFFLFTTHKLKQQIIKSGWLKEMSCDNFFGKHYKSNIIQTKSWSLWCKRRRCSFLPRQIVIIIVAQHYKRFTLCRSMQLAPERKSFANRSWWQKPLIHRSTRMSDKMEIERNLCFASSISEAWRKYAIYSIGIHVVFGSAWRTDEESVLE